MAGKFIRGSGWEWAMSAADVFTSGRAASTLDDHHIKRTRYAHQSLFYPCPYSSERHILSIATKCLGLQNHLSYGAQIVAWKRQCFNTGHRLSHSSSSCVGLCVPYEKVISICMCKFWTSYVPGSLHLTIQTMLIGCQSM